MKAIQANERYKTREIKTGNETLKISKCKKLLGTKKQVREIARNKQQ